MTTLEILQKWIKEYNTTTDENRKYWLLKNIKATEERIKRYEEINKDRMQFPTSSGTD